MAHRRRSGFSKTIDSVRWTPSSSTFAGIGGDATAALIAVGAGGEAETVLRVRGHVMCWLDATAAQGEIMQVSVGFILAQGGQSTTVLSSPSTDADARWIWHQDMIVASETAAVVSNELGIFRAEIDGKAMRKAGRDQEIQCVVETTTLLGSAAPTNTVVVCRWLVGH